MIDISHIVSGHQGPIGVVTPEREAKAGLDARNIKFNEWTFRWPIAFTDSSRLFRSPVVVVVVGILIGLAETG